MQGFPEGWVDGLSRTAALRCLGNAVVPQVAELLGRIILGGEASGVGSDGALLPTPNASDTSRSPTGAKKRMADGRQVCLGTVVALLPTPTAVYGGGSADAHLARKNADGGNRMSVTDLGMVVEQVLS